MECVKFDDDLLNGMKLFTTEDLLFVSIFIMGELCTDDISKETIDTGTIHLTKLYLYLAELYRRNIFTFENSDFIMEYKDFIKCTKQYKIGTPHFILFERLRNTVMSIKPKIVNEYNMLHTIKHSMLSILKKPLIAKDIQNKMECILDSNGNDLCVFKDFISSEHYKLICSGSPISDWTLENQEKLWGCIKDMK